MHFFHLSSSSLFSALPRFAFLTCLCVAFCAALSFKAFAGEVRIAASSNFHQTLTQLAQVFEQKAPGTKITLIFGSSGKHYAQVVHGAPFDAMFSADAERPELLEQQGLTVAGSRFTYALGRLALWTRGTLPKKASGEPDFLKLSRLAIANSRLAPYGLAAEEVLKELGVWEAVQKILVRGENIGQTFDFVRSGAAEAGLVAWPQVLVSGYSGSGDYWVPSDGLHSPIIQQAVQIKPGKETSDFLDFVRSAAGRLIIEKHGYKLPETP